MKVSNLGEVGQIRSKSGISMKRMMKADTLEEVSSKFVVHGAASFVQADDAKQDDPVEVEDVCDAQCKAEDDADDTGPVIYVNWCPHCTQEVRLAFAHTIDRICLRNVSVSPCVCCSSRVQTH